MEWELKQPRNGDGGGGGRGDFFTFFWGGRNSQRLASASFRWQGTGLDILFDLRAFGHLGECKLPHGECVVELVG